MRLSKRGGRTAGLAVAAMMALAACGGGGSSSSQAGSSAAPSGGSKGDITVEGCKPQNPLLPTNTNETCGGDILDQVLAKLVRYDPDTGAAKNDIAESIDTKDSKTFTVKLKRGVKFSDGTEVKAKNFVDAWNFGAYAPNAQLNSSWFEPIKGYDDLQGDKPKTDKMSGLTVVDDYTFKIQTAERNSTLPRQFGYTAFAAVPDSFFQDKGAAFGKLPVGAGPFKMVSGDPNKEFVLQADPNYDHGTKPSVQGVTFRVYDGADPAYQDLLAGNLDMGNQLPAAILASGAYQGDLGDRVMLRKGGVFQSITFPSPKSGDDSYKNPKLRQAISMAIDRATIVKTIFHDVYVPATGWVSPIVDGYKAGACGTYCDYNPTQAKALYDQVGGHKGPIEIAYNADSDHKAWVEAVCNQIKDALKTDCLPKPVPLFADFRQEIVKREMKSIFRTGWQMDYPSIENFLTPLYATKAGSNDGDYSNATFDAKLAEARRQVKPEDVLSTFQAAEQMLANDMPAIPLWYKPTISGHSTRIASAKFTVFGTYDFTSIVMK